MIRDYLRGLIVAVALLLAYADAAQHDAEPIPTYTKE